MKKGMPAETRSQFKDGKRRENAPDGNLTLSADWRVLCLGNDLLADDALGHAVAGQLQELAADVVFSFETGFDLLDYVLNVSSLLVVDTVITGGADPGTVYVLREEDLQTVPGNSPHYVGLLETLRLARKLRLPVAENVVVIAVEGADCFTVGGSMHPAVEAAIPQVVALARDLMATPRQAGCRGEPAGTS